MSIVRIGKPVKYKGVMYPSNVDIEIDQKDVEDVLARGGWLVDSGNTVQPDTRQEPSALGDTVQISEIEKLREHAEALGIDVKKTWGIQRLKNEIEKVTE